MSTSPTPLSPSRSGRRPPAPRHHKSARVSLAHRQLRDDAFWQKIPAYAEVDEETFIDHKWQMKHSAYGEDKLIAFVSELMPPELVEDVREGFRRAPMAVRITPYLLSLIDWKNPLEDPIRRQFIPMGSTMHADHPMLRFDSLAEQQDAPVPGLTHRYPDKALFLPLDTCPVYCRFCTRSYAIGTDTESVEKVSLKINPQRWEQAFEYIANTPELEDIVVSGGDAANLPAKHLLTIGERLLEMPNIRRIRFATKGLAVIPMKALSDEAWFQAFAKLSRKGRKLHKEVCIHTHFNHPNEITEISRRATGRLFEAGITVRNQSVLQRGVNDTVEEQVLLTKRLGEINVQPYYVYQHDMVPGVEELRTKVEDTVALEKAVRGVTAGFNTPTFVVDAPGGGGKRDVHSAEHYDPRTGISVYTAPSVKPGARFLYFDPLHSLDESMAEAWQDEREAERMVEDAIRRAE